MKRIFTISQHSPACHAAYDVTMRTRMIGRLGEEMFGYEARD